MSTIKVNSIKNTSTNDGGIAIDNSGHVQIDGQQLPTAGALSNRNLIINGAMQVAQRATTSTGTGGGYRTVDRFSYRRSGYTPNLTISQDTDAPDGFAYSTKILVSTAATPGANGYSEWRTNLEAQNLQHLSYGSASAKALTLSFYVKSNVTGTYGVALTQNDSSRRQSATYTVSSSDTWEYKTITIAGDASGTIDNNNDSGLALRWALSAGSDYTTGSNGTWATTLANHYAGHAVDLTGTNGNTWHITGIQLEVGEKATPFEHRSFGDELLRCQRYYYRVSASSTGFNLRTSGYATSSTNARVNIPYGVDMRLAPTALEQSGTAGDYSVRGLSNVNCNAVPAHFSADTHGALVDLSVASGLTAGQGAFLRTVGSNAFFAWSAEL